MNFVNHRILRQLVSAIVPGASRFSSVFAYHHIILFLLIYTAADSFEFSNSASLRNEGDWLKSHSSLHSNNKSDTAFNISA